MDMLTHLSVWILNPIHYTGEYYTLDAYISFEPKNLCFSTIFLTKKLIVFEIEVAEKRHGRTEFVR